MTRRDLIIVAVLANIGVLGILFMMAFRTEEETVKDNKEIAYTITEETVNTLQPSVEPEISTKPEKADPIDIIDAALEEENANPAPSLITADDENFQVIEPETQETKQADVAPVESSDAKVVEVTVKRGDALEKIARANGTTVEAIMKANNLKSDRLSIGQTLKVPVGAKKSTKASSNDSAKASKQIAQADTKGSAEYYTLKSGDNPWKIAKQFHLKLEDLLKLNNLNEEKARSLKVGDTIRVK